jgi:hypothetical protein
MLELEGVALPYAGSALLMIRDVGLIVGGVN